MLPQAGHKPETAPNIIRFEWLLVNQMDHYIDLSI